MVSIMRESLRITFKTELPPGPKSPQQSQQNLKVTFGIMPSYGADKKGLAVDGVRKDGPAGKAGLVKGDIISEIEVQFQADLLQLQHHKSYLETSSNPWH